MKSILMSIKPQHVANILNGLKTIEVRKRFPKDYVGWVYIYCTKKAPYGVVSIKWDNKHDMLGKVVARFWCDKVEEIIFGTTLYNDLGFFTCDLHDFDLYKQSCLTKKEMHNYLKVKPNGLSGYAIHITKLEIFDKPKEISEFSSKIEKTCICFNQFVAEGTRKVPLTRAPESWQYIEV